MGTRSQEEKANVIGEMLEMKVDEPTRLDFSEQVWHIWTSRLVKTVNKVINKIIRTDLDAILCIYQ